MPSVKTHFHFMQPEQVHTIKGWRKLDPEVDEFVFCWNRWKKWQTEPPIVVAIGTKVVGYHGVSFTNSKYTNSVSQFVLPEYRGRGLAVGMINRLLEQADAKGMHRLRFRCPEEDGPGLALWTSFGLVPFAKGKGDLWFDVNIAAIRSVSALRSYGLTLHLPPTTDNRRLSYYRRSGLTPLLPEYKELL